MISYKPFYKSLLERDMTEYQLIFKHGFSSHILHRMKHGEAISTKTLDTLCFILGCRVEDILEYVDERDE
jgi:DNA-binding Xre family transcriptional regulator